MTLKHMCYKYGVDLYSVNEYLTSKTCSSCGSILEIGTSEIYSCSKCLLKTGRDENASKNILKCGLYEGCYIHNKKVIQCVTH